mgnify:CR=1 FL=1
MCLGIPLKVKAIKDSSTASVELGDSELEISTVFTPEVKVRDYVIVHAGFSISILTEDEAEEIKELLDNG